MTLETTPKMTLEKIPYGRMTRAQIASLGLPESWQIAIKDYVRFDELDALNHVNNKAYLTWFETVRVMYMMDLGLSYSDPSSLKFVVRTASAEYIRPIFLPQDYCVLARVSSLGRTSFMMDYAVYSNGQIHAKGDSQLVLLQPDGQKSTPIPDDMRVQMTG